MHQCLPSVLFLPPRPFLFVLFLFFFSLLCPSLCLCRLVNAPFCCGYYQVSAFYICLLRRLPFCSLSIATYAVSTLDYAMSYAILLDTTGTTYTFYYIQRARKPTREYTDFQREGVFKQRPKYMKCIRCSNSSNKPDHQQYVTSTHLWNKHANPVPCLCNNNTRISWVYEYGSYSSLLLGSMVCIMFGESKMKMKNCEMSGPDSVWLRDWNTWKRVWFANKACFFGKSFS